MKKTTFTLAAVLFACVSFAQSKNQVNLESKPVPDANKQTVRTVKILPKESVKKAEPANKQSARKESSPAAAPARKEEKKK